MHLVRCLFAAILIVTGCTQQQMYESMDENRRQECEKYTDYQREKCLQANDMDYQQYQDLRDKEVSD